MILKHFHPWASLRYLFPVLNWNSFHSLKLGSVVHQRSWLEKYLCRRFYQMMMMMWAETRQQHWILHSTLIIPLLLREWVSRAFLVMDLLRSHPCVSKLISYCNHIPVLGFRPSLHIPFSYLGMDRTPVAPFYFSFWSPMSSSTHFWRSAPVPSLIPGSSEAMGTAGGQLPAWQGDLPGLAGTVTFFRFQSSQPALFRLEQDSCLSHVQLQEAAKLLKNPALEFWICCRGFCSDLINGNISPLKPEGDCYGTCQAFKINFYKVFSGVKRSERGCNTEWDCWAVTELGCEQGWDTPATQGCNVTSLHTREWSQEVVTVRSQEQDCDILILYSLKSSCASNVFFSLIKVYALKIMPPTSS